MTRRSLSIPIATIFSLVALLAFGHTAHASSTVWNTTISGAAGICDVNCQPTSANFGFNNPNISIQYRALIKNTDTGEIIPPNGSVPIGTKLQLIFDKHVSEDIYWFATGGYMDSPYGDWGDPNVRPPGWCVDKDYLSSQTDLETPGASQQHFVQFPVRIPVQSVSGNSGLLSCSPLAENGEGSFVQECTATGTGSLPLSFDFGPTIGKFYAEYKLFQNGAAVGCGGIGGNSPMLIKSGGYWQYGLVGRTTVYSSWGVFSAQPGAVTDSVKIDAESIPYPINISPVTSGPSMPGVVGGSCIVGAAYSVSITSSDSNGHKLRYGIDWDNDGTLDQYVPPIGYVSSGSTQTASRTYSTNGQKKIRVIAQNDRGAVSSSAEYTFSCNTASCPIGYILQGTACIFSACPSGYKLQGTQCVASNQCTTPNYCKDKDIVDGCTDKVVQICDWGCYSGRCKGIPPPSGTISAVPSLVHPGQTSSISWTSENVESCTVKSNNQDNWTGLSSPGTISNPITSQTIFTLRCKALEGATPSTIQKSVPVNIAPTWQEPK